MWSCIFGFMSWCCAINTHHAVLPYKWMPVPHWDHCALRLSLLWSTSSKGQGGTWLGVEGCGLSQKLGGLSVRQAALHCGIPQSTLRFSRRGFPTAPTKTLLCAVFHLHPSLLFSCFSVTTKHISFFLLIIKKNNKHTSTTSCDCRLESWLCYLVVFTVLGWCETLIMAEKVAPLSTWKVQCFWSDKLVFNNIIIDHCANQYSAGIHWLGYQNRSVKTK